MLPSSYFTPPVIFLKNVLGAVPMVHVPVEDEDTQGIVGNALSVAGGQGSRVEEAEAAGVVSFCVMPRGAYDSHAVPHLHTTTKPSEIIRCSLYTYILQLCTYV